MKNYFIVISFLLLITQVYAQQSITINGKIENSQSGDGSIKKEWFNTQTMSEEEEVIDFKISEDGNFSVQLKDSFQGFTRYWLRLGNGYTHLYLTTGDSLFMTVDAERFDESIQYSGKGAGRNNYRKEVYVMFMNRNAENTYLWIENPDAFLINLNGYIDKKMNLLNKYSSSGEIDSVYYQFEKERIEIYHAAMRLRYGIRYNLVYDSRSTFKELDLILKYAETDNIMYLQESDFREIVRDYPDFKLKLSSGKWETPVSDKINFAKKNYNGLILTFYYHGLINSCIDNAASPVERSIILKYLSKNINDPLSNKLIKELKQELYSYQNQNGDLFENAVVASICIVLFVILLFLINRITKKIGHINFKYNWAAFLKYSMYIIAGIAMVSFIEKYRIIGIITGITWIAVYIAHNYVVIPKLVIRKKYYHYAASVALLMVIFIAGMYFTDIIRNEMGYPNHRETKLWRIVTYLLLGYILIIISWISYYVHILAKEKNSIKNLVKEKRLNLEVVFNVCLVLVCYIITLANQQSSMNLHQILPFYTAIIIFYIQAFLIIPKYFNKDKLRQLVFSNALMLLVIAAGMVMVNAFHSYISASRLGIEVSIIDVISFKNSINIERLVVSVLIIVPAFTYNYIKKQLQNQESTGYKLFRKKEAELEQLRSQVNPHFLFNTLNTLYAFALKEKSEKTAECIAKLANLMRFMIDDMSKDYILLKNEIGYIQDYIKLQSIRSSVEHDIKINIDIEDDKMYQLAPMLLIPFVENAFKHGINPNEISQLKIDINANDNQIQVVIENSIDANFEAYYKEKGFGIGIENVKKRLGHIYPGKHNISVAKTDDRFIVIVKIEVNNTVS